MARPFQVSRESQLKQRAAELRQEMAEISTEPEEPREPEEPILETLEQLVEDELKRQLKQGSPPAFAIPNAIKFLAVRARLPVQFGSELDANG